jgi:hypothetical protein
MFFAWFVAALTGVACVVGAVQNYFLNARLRAAELRIQRYKRSTQVLVDLLESEKAAMKVRIAALLDDATALILAVDDATWGHQTTEWRVRAQRWRESNSMLLTPRAPMFRYYHGRTRQEIDDAEDDALPPVAAALESQRDSDDTAAAQRHHFDVPAITLGSPELMGAPDSTPPEP